MDDMKIESTFLTRIISKIINSVIRKKLGYDIKVVINKINISVIDGKTHAHLDIDADMDKSEIEKIVKNFC